jgi:hypothetical protein
MGINKVVEVFFNAINTSDRKKGNYHEFVLNYFSLLFSRYAS